MSISYLLCHAAVVLGLAAGLGDASLFNITDVHHYGGVNATNFFKSPSEVLAIPLRRVDHGGIATPSILKRFFKTDVLGVYGAAYMAEMAIGTGSNPQVVDVLIDTGSFELWVNPDCTASDVPDLCDAFGHYDPARSPSARKVNGDFNIEYGSGSASGPYTSDDIYISGAKIQNQQFGVANMSDLVWFGIMGLGHGLGNGFINYPLVVDSLAAQGFTNSKLFSLDLGAQANPGLVVTGQIVFGGVDTNKYSGHLAKVPTDPTDPHYKITLNSLSHHAPDSAGSTALLDDDLPLPVIVDSGTTLSLLPEPIVAKLAAQFPGATPDDNGGYKVPCHFQDEHGESGSIDFEFLSPDGGRVTISVLYRDFIWKSGQDCVLGAVHAEDIGVWILGDTFLRGAYVTFDQSNNALYMANYRPCGQGPNLVPVPAGLDHASHILGSCLPPHPSPHPPHPPPPPPPPPPSSITSANPSEATPDPDVSRIDDGGEQGDLDPDCSTRTTTTTTTPKITVTSTLTRALAYTVTACPDAEPECEVEGQVGRVATRFETTVTTFCPEDEGGDVNAFRPTAAAIGIGLIHESSAPVATTAWPTRTAAAAVAVAVTLQQDEYQVPAPEQEKEGGLLLSTQVEQPQPEQGLAEVQQGEESESESEILITRCSTSTYALSTCDPSASTTCTLDETTTRVITIVETVLQLKPLTSSLPPPHLAISEYNTPPPPRITPAWSLAYNNQSSNSGIAWGITGFAGASRTSSGSSSSSSSIAPLVDVATKGKGKGKTPTQTKTSKESEESDTPFTSAATAVVDDGLAGRAYVVLAVSAVLGFFFLL